MDRVCVYCGSSTGSGEAYADAARALGDLLVSAGIGLVYGGAARGLMGILADRVIAGGGEVQGVIPAILKDKEIAHEGLTKLHVVDSMHDRKSLMALLADGFVAMPGGFGTIEEIVEVLTWGQLQFHAKPCGLLNVDGYFDHLLAFLDHARQRGFLKPEHRGMLLVDDNPAGLIGQFEHYAPPGNAKW